MNKILTVLVLAIALVGLTPAVFAGTGCCPGQKTAPASCCGTCQTAKDCTVKAGCAALKADSCPCCGTCKSPEECTAKAKCGMKARCGKMAKCSKKGACGKKAACAACPSAKADPCKVAKPCPQGDQHPNVSNHYTKGLPQVAGEIEKTGVVRVTFYGRYHKIDKVMLESAGETIRLVHSAKHSMRNVEKMNGQTVTVRGKIRPASKKHPETAFEVIHIYPVQ